MKPFILFTFTMVLTAFRIHGQVSINTDGSQPDQAAILELKSNEKGFLPPRLTTLQIWQIADPPAGLMVFNTDSCKLSLFDGTNWHEMLPGNCIPLPSVAHAGNDQVLPSNDTAMLGADVPTIGNGRWSIIAGTGGVFSDTTNPASLFWGPPVAEFTLRWSVSTGCGTSHDDVSIRFLNVDTIIYVSVLGNDTSAGTMAQPVRTIQQGITLALASGKTKVNITAGTYAGSVSLASSVHLYGGFDSLTWTRNPAVYVTTVLGGSTAVSGSAVTNITIDGISVYGSNASGAGVSAYGVFLANCSGIRIASCSITSANGTQGTNGVPGQSGASGNGGGMGQGGCENSTWPCSTCNQPQGGGGASSPFGSYGGHGGSAGLGPEYGYQGAPGGGAGGGAGAQGCAYFASGSCFGYEMPGFPCNGSNGADGANGSNGAGGSAFGTFAPSGYIPSGGSSGGNGIAGGGGGGGSGGHGGESGCDSYGSGGGGGGSGGQQGTPGTGGTGGTGSFAVWCFNSQIEITNCSLITGNGGNGGPGAAGGSGGQGGNGAPCGNHTSGQDDGGCGGYGGDGGHGGTGGSGGGGGGGPTIGISKDAVSSVSQSGNTFVLGQGGAGGTSSGNPGQNGTRANTNF